MYKVLIADDELLVRVGLKTTIDWEGNSFSVVGEARNGKEALDLFKQHQPDILLTDVGMPDMNGLELIQALKLINENLKSIILTHHDDFNYAHQAINLGVVSYILKSNLTEENLLKHLKKAAGLLGPRENIKLQKADPKIIDKALQGEHLSEQQVQELKLASFPNNRYMVVSLQFHDESPDTGLPAAKILNFEKVITSISNHVFTDSNLNVVPIVRKNETLFIFNMPGTEEFHERPRNILSIVHLLKKNIKKYLNLNISIGLSRQANSFYALASLYEEANRACRDSFFEPDNICFFNPVSAHYSKFESEIDTKELNLLIEDKNTEGISKFLHHHFLETARAYDTQSLLADFNTLMDYLREPVQVSEQEHDVKILPHINSESELFARFYNISALIKYLTDLYTEYLKTVRERKSISYNSHIIRKSMEYIRRHSAENISLQTVADSAEVSRSYLSFLFKQELGINFSTYITEIRIDKAKKLLVSSNMRIYEIAEKVGFDSPYYFSKVFKDTCGMTCKQYRSTHYSPEYNYW
ncbi:response regulator [Marispirochaeta sp.]|uniref:response regulator transcription factor n=1 Tax=Marispirochaeta sp. TaxID=2038653 RepID=UPI0029C91E0B|nr:response regulator [Marispirochaeta sp.]